MDAPREPHSGPGPRRPRNVWVRHFAAAMEMPFILAGSVLLAGLGGYLLDARFGTGPWLMIVLGGLGFFAGVREVLRRLPKDTDGEPRNSGQ
jgi:F0F1-type ATP synthase assembly protein I